MYVINPHFEKDTSTDFLGGNMGILDLFGRLTQNFCKKVSHVDLLFICAKTLKLYGPLF